MFALHLWTTTAPHKQLQPAKLRDAPDGVCEGVGCARQQSEAARNDSRGVFVNSNLRPSSTKNSQDRKTTSSHAREPSAMATSPTKKRFSPRKKLSSRRVFLLILGAYPKRTRKRTLRSCESTILGPKKGSKGPKSSGLLFICMNFSMITSKNGSWL